MTDETTLYEDARIDAVVVSMFDSPASPPEPFWISAYTNTIRRVRSLALLSGAPAPPLREVAALILNDPVLDGMAEAGARRAVAGDEVQGFRAQENRRWLYCQWCELGAQRRGAIAGRIAAAAACPLAVVPAAGGDSVAVGDLVGPWLDGGRLLWNLDGLPDPVRREITSVAAEFFRLRCGSELSSKVKVRRRREESPAVVSDGPTDALREHLIQTIASAGEAAVGYEAISVAEGRRLAADVAVWSARLGRPVSLCRRPGS